MRFQVETTASPGIVFAEIADFANLENWDPFVRRSWLEAGEPLYEGAAYLFEAPGLSLRYRIIDIDHPKFVVYQGGTKRVRSTDTIEISPREGGGSMIAVTSDIRFHGFMKALAPLVLALVWLGGRLLSVPGMRRHLSSLS